MAIPKTLAEEIRRREATGDDWYTSDLPYALEIRGPSELVPGGSVVFVLPLGPETHVTTTVLRQSVAPTIGGLSVEERGLLWRQIQIEGTFGLFPKTGRDTTDTPEPPVGGELLSGPGWFKRLEQNVIGKYAGWKVDPDRGSDVRLIWHDTRKDDHWVVVPETLESRRTAQRRLQYPYMLSLKAVEEASAATVSLTSESAAAKFNILTMTLGSVAGLDEVRAGLAKVKAGIEYGSAVVRHIRSFVSEIDAVLGDLDEVVQLATEFVDEARSTISSPRSFIQSVAATLESVLLLMENVVEFPMAVRQNYQTALDGVHQIASQIAVFGDRYEQRIEPVRSLEQGAGRYSTGTLEAAEGAGPPKSMAEMDRRAVRSTDLAQIRDGGGQSPRLQRAYAGFREHTIQSGDSLEGLAAQFMGDPSFWYDIALCNALQPPYLSPTGAPGTLGPGSTLVIPLLTQQSTSQVPSAGGGQTALDDLLGTGILLTESAHSKPGRPAVDFAVDRRTNSDIARVTGIDNLAQALQMRVWTERGTMLAVPTYGLRRLVGFGVTAADLTALRLAARETVEADSRVKQVQRLRFAADGDIVDIEMDVVAIGATSNRTLRSSLI